MLDIPFIKSPFFFFHLKQLNWIKWCFFFIVSELLNSVYKNIGKNVKIICIWWHFSSWCERYCMFFSTMIAFTRHTMPLALYFTVRLAVFTKGWQLYSNWQDFRGSGDSVPGLSFTIGCLCCLNMKSQRVQGRLNRVSDKKEIKT